MDANKLRLAKLHRECVGLYYSPVAYDAKEHVTYAGETEIFTPCYFCNERADYNHFTPALQIFNEWIDKEQFRLLEQTRLTVCPVCIACLEKLDKSVSVSLDDQAAFLNSIKNGTFKPMFHRS